MHCIHGPVAKLILALTVAAAGASCADAPRELLQNGTFDQGSGTSPAAWGGTWGTEASNRFLHLAGGTAQVSATRTIALSGQKGLELAWRVRHRDLANGAGQNAFLAIDLIDGAGQVVLPGPAYPTFTGSTTGWQKGSARFFVPAGATALRLTPTLSGQTGGSLDLDDFSLVAVHPNDVPEELLTTGKIAIDAGKGLPPALHVDGRRIVDATGKELWLQGLSVPSLEWNAAGDAIITSIVTGIEVWKANIIRLPVKADFWFGTAKGQSDGGTAYRALVDQAVLASGSRGAYVILDLHRFRAPDDSDVAFWKDAATRYKDHPTVIFGLFNEPHDLTWEVWKSGGTVTDKAKPGDAALKENKDAITSFTTCGMQGLIDAVRGTGARNAVLVGGLDWAYDLSGVLNGFDLDDHGGNGIIWDTHVYPWKSDWQGKFLAVAKVRAVLIGEVGCDKVRYDFIPPERFEDPYTWAPDMVGCIQQNRLHWTAWAFHPHCGPAMLQNQTTFAPTPFWGSFVRAALLGERFTPVRLR